MTDGKYYFLLSSNCKKFITFNLYITLLMSKTIIAYLSLSFMLQTHYTATNC